MKEGRKKGGDWLNSLAGLVFQESSVGRSLTSHGEEGKGREEKVKPGEKGKRGEKMGVAIATASTRRGSPFISLEEERINQSKNLEKKKKLTKKSSTSFLVRRGLERRGGKGESGRPLHLSCPRGRGLGDYLPLRVGKKGGEGKKYKKKGQYMGGKREKGGKLESSRFFHSRAREVVKRWFSSSFHKSRGRRRSFGSLIAREGKKRRGKNEAGSTRESSQTVIGICQKEHNSVVTVRQERQEDKQQKAQKKIKEGG